jgi:hypothetical protein
MIATVVLPRSRPRDRLLRSALLMVVAASIGLLLLGASCSEKDVVDRLTIVNRTPFNVDVQVADAEKESWLILRRARRESSTVNEMVTDVGPTWVFRFRYGGRDVGELTIDRDELRRARWRVQVPSEVADRMRELGFEPPPDR